MPLPIDPTLGTDPTTFVELIKTVGFPALIFAIWYLYHRAENQKWEQHFQAQCETIQAILKQSDGERERQFAHWKELSDVLYLQTAQLARLETKISSNEFCPITRRQRE